MCRCQYGGRSQPPHSLPDGLRRFRVSSSHWPAGILASRQFSEEFATNELGACELPEAKRHWQRHYGWLSTVFRKIQCSRYVNGHTNVVVVARDPNNVTFRYICSIVVTRICMCIGLNTPIQGKKPFSRAAPTKTTIAITTTNTNKQRAPPSPRNVRCLSIILGY